jgi:hypothetical protein
MPTDPQRPTSAARTHPINQVGKCTLTITHGGKSATVDVVSFDNAAQADISLKLDAAGKLTATRG